MRSTTELKFDMQWCPVFWHENSAGKSLTNGKTHLQQKTSYITSGIEAMHHDLFLHISSSSPINKSSDITAYLPSISECKISYLSFNTCHPPLPLISFLPVSPDTTPPWLIELHDIVLFLFMVSYSSFSGFLLLVTLLTLCSSWTISFVFMVLIIISMKMSLSTLFPGLFLP